MKHRRNCMRQYQIVKKPVEELQKIVCNKCGKEIPVIQGEPQEEVLAIEKRWGYFSKKDNQFHRFEICEDCYDEFVQSFCIKIEIEN